MTTLPKSGTIQVRVKPGSALERLLSTSEHGTISGALHEIAAQHEAMVRAEKG
jgi:hypothetical protein